MRAFLNFSPTSLMDKYLQTRFRSAGLVSKFVETDTDGTTMHCWVPKGKPSGHVEKPALVMLHGFGSTAVWQWYKQISGLLPFFDVYVPDLLYFGQSFTLEKERSEMFQAERVMELMRSLGVPEFSLLGTLYDSRRQRESGFERERPYCCRSAPACLAKCFVGSFNPAVPSTTQITSFSASRLLERALHFKP